MGLRDKSVLVSGNPGFEMVCRIRTPATNLRPDDGPRAKKKPCGTARLRLRNHGLFYLAFFPIFPCAQRCFISRDIFLRAAALMRPPL